MIIDIALLPTHIAEQVMTCQEPIYFAKDGKVVKSVSSAPNYAKGDFNFDLERMKQAVESSTNAVPVPKSALADIDAFDGWLASIAQ